MGFLTSLKRTYGLLIRTPGLGPFVAGPVRFAKRLLHDPTARLQSKLDFAVAASAGLRNDLDATSRRQAELAAEVELLRITIAQQTALLDVLTRVPPAAAPAAGREAQLAKVVVRTEWRDGAVREIDLPFDRLAGKLNGADIAVLRESDSSDSPKRGNGLHAA